jgi:hypothetical protein
MHLHVIATLRALHVLSGALWVGAAFLNAFYLVPAMRAVGPAGGAVMRNLVQVRRLPVFMNVIMGLNLLTGFVLITWTSGGFQPAWFATAAGMAFTIGALSAIVTSGIGFTVTVPTVKRIGALSAAIGSGPATPEQAQQLGALQGRMITAARIGTSLLVVATVAMAVARYL